MSTPAPIPRPYRLLFTIIEPLFATLGAIQALLAPATLLRYSVPSVSYAASMAPLFTQMSGSWLMFAFHDVVTLRIYRDNVAVWRHVLAAALLSDVGYTASLVQSMGAAWFFNPLRWDAANAFTVVSTVVPMVAKVLFLLGVGLPREGTRREIRKDL